MSGERDHELYQRRGARNWAVGLTLFALIVLVYVVTIVKLGVNVTSPFAENFKTGLKYRDETPIAKRPKHEVAPSIDAVRKIAPAATEGAPK
ncbi:MAG: hypothetical protein MRY74_00875 [Neomegalonema sp.]|nr:hypothetical protein [Neomegalonema sp.]